MCRAGDESVSSAMNSLLASIESTIARGTPQTRAKALEHAIKARIDASEQVLLLLNRRGYSPVLYCPDCQWTSDCPNCSAHQVLHKMDHRLHCHHCGQQTPAVDAPGFCPWLCGHK